MLSLTYSGKYLLLENCGQSSNFVKVVSSHRNPPKVWH